MKETSGSRRFGLVRWVVVFICLSAFFWFASTHVSEIIDDAYISFRYAKNLAEGRGLVFNEGERVEGYTNFLWVLIMAAGQKAGFDLPRLSRMLAILCAALLAVAIALFSQSRFRGQPFRHISYLAPALMAISPLYLEHIGTGLETVLFSLLMFLSLTSHVSGEKRKAFPYLTGFLLGLGYLTRPEAVIWAFSFLLVDTINLALSGEGRAENVKRILKYACPFALIVAAHLPWRVGYYDSWLPNTYYAKAGENWLWGIVFTVSFMLSSGWLPLIALATGPFLLRKKWAAYMYVIMLLMFIHNLRIGGDFIFTGRFLYPLLPLTYILVQELFRLASISISNLTGHPGRKFLLRAAQVMIFILFVLGALWGLRINKWAVRFSRELNMQNKLLAKCLTENTEPSDTIAVMAAGIIPYYCDRNMIDMIGLADRHIARFGITDKRCTIAHQKGDSEYVLDRRPEIILLAPPRRELMRMTYPLRLDVAANNQLHANPRFWEQYEMADFDCDMYPVGVFVRKNIQTDSP